MYVKPEFRILGVAKKMADSIVLEAQEKSFTKFLGSVCPSAKGATLSLQVLLAYGMSLKSASDNFILLEKDI